MLLSTTTFICTAATGPKFWFAWSEPGDAIKEIPGWYYLPENRIPE